MIPMRRNFSACHRGADAGDESDADTSSARWQHGGDGCGDCYEPSSTPVAPPKKSRSLHLSPEVNASIDGRSGSNGCPSN